MTNRFFRPLIHPGQWVGVQWGLLRRYGIKRRVMAVLRKVAGPPVRFVDKATRKSVRLRHALLFLARKLGVHHRVMRFYQYIRMQQAAKAHQGRVFELSESQKRAQSAWLPQSRNLEVDELLSRIRNELQTQPSSPRKASKTPRRLNHVE